MYKYILFSIALASASAGVMHGIDDRRVAQEFLEEQQRVLKCMGDSEDIQYSLEDASRLYEYCSEAGE